MNDLEFGSFNFTNILTYVQTKKTHPLISTYFWSWIHKSSSTFVLTKYFLDFWFIIKCVQVYLCQKLFFLKNMGENMLCTKIVLNVRNNFCTQHVLPRFELGTFMYWIVIQNEQSVVILWVSWCKNKSFWQRFTCTQRYPRPNFQHGFLFLGFLSRKCWNGKFLQFFWGILLLWVFFFTFP